MNIIGNIQLPACKVLYVTTGLICILLAWNNVEVIGISITNRTVLMKLYDGHQFTLFSLLDSSHFQLLSLSIISSPMRELKLALGPVIIHALWHLHDCNSIYKCS